MENLHLWFFECRKVTININVLNIEMEPRMGDRENWTNRKFRKLNQRKICISNFLSAERSPLVQFSKFSFGLVIPFNHPRFHFNIKHIYAWTFMCGDLSALRNQRCKFSIDSVFRTFQKPEMQIFCWFSFLNFPLVQFSLSPFLGSISTFKAFMCGDLSALKKPEMQIFHWFSCSNFPLIWLSPSPFLGSISMFKTFMHGDLSALRNRRCEFSIDSVFWTFPWFSFPYHPS